MIAADVSKYVSGCNPASWITRGKTVTKTLYANAAVVPIATSVSMFAAPWRAARQAAA